MKNKIDSSVKNCPECGRPGVEPYNIYGQSSWFCDKCRHYGPWSELNAPKSVFVKKTGAVKQNKPQSVASKLLASLTGT